MGLVFGPLGLLFVLMSGSKKPAASPAAATEVPSFEVRVEVDHSHGRRREPDLSLSRPAPEGSYRGLNDWKDSLTTVWSGARPPIEFTYENRQGKRQRRKVAVNRIQVDSRGCIYLGGHCQVRDEDRTFSIDNITTMIKTGGRRYEVMDWIEEVAGLDW